MRRLDERPRVYRRTERGVMVRTYATDWEAWMAWFTAPRRERLAWRAAGDRRAVGEREYRRGK